MKVYQVEFKTEEIEKEWDDLVSGRRGSALLVPLALSAVAAITEVSKTIPVVTCIYRTPRLYGYSSVHELGRGIDFRVWKLSEEEIEEIETRVNSGFIYRAGDGRILPALAFHKKGTGAHLHGQAPEALAWTT